MEKTDKYVIKLVEKFARSFFQKGIITEDDLNLPKSELFEKIAEIVTSGKIFYSIDHTEDILLQAELFYKAEQYHFAKVFYSMFFEHSLNALIRKECEKRDISEKVKMDIIRSVDIYGKLTWLPALIGWRTFNIVHFTTIKRLADDRNGFVHYKWKPIEDKEESQVEASRLKSETKQQFVSIKKAIKYLRFYSSTQLYDKKKKIIDKKFGQSKN